MSALYLIPVTLGDVEHRRVLPEYNREVILPSVISLSKMYVRHAVS